MRLIICTLLAAANLYSAQPQQPASAPPSLMQAALGMSPANNSKGPTYHSPQTLTDMARLQEAALASDYAYEQTRHLSSNIGPRLSGSPEAQAAVEYVAEEMRRLGLSVTLQKVMVPHWVRGIETGAVIEAPGLAKGTTQKIVLTALGGSVSTGAEGISADIVVANTFDELEALGRDKVAGKIVVFNYPFDLGLQESGFGGEAYGRAVAYRARGAVAAAKLGAVATLIRSAGDSRYRSPHTGLMRYDDRVQKIPAAAITHEDAELLSNLVKQGKVRVHITLTPQTLPDAVSYNVIGELKGSEKPDEIVVIGGHLDSWDLGTGAQDDACGVALSMGAAQLIKKLGLKPKRSIRVIAFMAEEVGIFGGRAYYAENKENMKNHFAAIESDTGASHTLGINYAGKKEIEQVLRPISKLLEKQGAPMIEKGDGVGGDIEPMSASGVPQFAPKVDMRTYFKYHHTPADTFDKIDKKELNEQGAVMVLLAYGLANLELPLPR